MKKIAFVLAAAVVASLAAFADGTTPRRVRPRGMAKPSGGIVERAYSGKVIRVWNAQKSLPSDEVAGIVREQRLTAQLPIEAADGIALTGKFDSPIAAAAEAAKAGGVGAAVLVVEDPALPIILASPDQRWAILNVSGIGDEPGKAKARFGKLLWNAVARAIGAGGSGDRGCVLGAFSSVEDIDRIRATMPSPMAHNAMIEVASSIGVGMITFSSYRTACQQGWAPTPTNDVQKAIWDEVHAIPKNPMKIEFDPKKGR